MTPKELHETYLQLPPEMPFTDKWWGICGAIIIGYTIYRLLTW